MNTREELIKKAAKAILDAAETPDEPGVRNPQVWGWARRDAAAALAVFEDFLRYRLLPNEVIEYMNDYLEAMNETAPPELQSECRDCGRTDGGCDRIVEPQSEPTDMEGLLDTRAGLALANAAWTEGASAILRSVNAHVTGPWSKPVSPYSSALLEWIMSDRAAADTTKEQSNG